LLAVIAARVPVREPVSRRVAVLREVQIALPECSLSVLAFDSVRSAILVAQLANGARIDFSPASESADKSPDPKRIARESR
jgi:hypothetical protein